ncbi:MAG: beta-ketoacyl-ACP synthase II [Chloroflexi bacterium]|nr:beta-ketoacyl-ACP synthase II [Chloroflexota bacterium]
MGAVTPVGLCVEEFWSNLKAGVSGCALITQFDAGGFPTRIAGEVKGFDPLNFIEPKEARRMSRVLQFAIAASRMALDQSGLKVDDSNAHDVGVIVGSGIGSLTTTEKECKVLIDRGGMKVNPFFLPMMLPNMASAQVSRMFGAKGYNTSIVTACASGGHAIGEAVEVIRRGAANAMITGGAEASICALGMAAFCVIKALSQRNDEPEKASRPFDLNRDGFVPAEAAGALVIESLEHALRRDANILAEIVGYGATGDAYHVVAPEPEAMGISEAMRRSLRDAGISPDEIYYVNAHATSTEAGDAAETVGLKKVFGEHAGKLMVNSTKSMIGHPIGAAGGVEMIACVKTILDGVVHPTINYETPDPACDLDYVPNVARETQVEVAMSNSFGFGGQNASLIVRRFEP